MSEIPRLNTTFQERSDFEDDIQTIEANQRHDLGLHLYSAFLSHQVNPNYPPSQWASWPAYPSLAQDPQISAEGEDLLLTHSPYETNDRIFQQAVQLRAHGAKHDPRKAILDKSNTKVGIRYKRQQVTSPQTTLVNEMHFVLQRKIRKLAKKRQGHVRGAVSLANTESRHMQIMATRLANRLGSLMAQIARQSHRVHQKTPNNMRIEYMGGWQDVAMANIYNDKLRAHIDVDFHRRFYRNLRSLFYNTPFPYEYDPEAYFDEEEGVPEEVPDFDIEQNLNAIESVGLAPEGLPRGQNLIQQRLTDYAYKERVILGLLDQAVREKQLSWAETKGAMGYYKPEGEFYRRNRKAVFRDVSLGAKDFVTGSKRAQ